MLRRSGLNLLTSCLVLSALIFILFIHTVESTECTMKCSVLLEDDLESCWVQSVDYFTEKLQNALNDFAKIRIYISRWKKEHEESADKYAVFLDDVVDRILKKNTVGPIHTPDLRDIFNLTLNLTEKLEAVYKDAVHLPQLSCPISCSYDNSAWIALFALSMTITILTLFVTGAYTFKVYCERKQERRRNFVIGRTDSRQVMMED